MAKNPILKYEYDNEKMNYETFWYEFNKLKAKAVSMFEWINLPKEIDERYLELMLCEQGFVCFFKDDITDINRGSTNSNLETIPENGQYFALQCTLGGRFNVYNIPTIYQVYTASGYQARRSAKNSIIIFNNLMHTPTTPILMYNARKITNVERTIDINLNQLKRPYIFLVPENQRLTFQKLISDIISNKDIVIGNNNLDIQNVNIQSTISPNNTLDLYTLKKRYYGQALNDIGIDYNPQDKKERVISQEITSSEEDTYMTRMSMLNARKQACKQINEMFGLDIDVKFRYDEIKEEMKDIKIDGTLESGEE